MKIKKITPPFVPKGKQKNLWSSYWRKLIT
jgi:hypothetical protein